MHEHFLKHIKHWHILTVTTFIALLYYSWSINSWKFAFVGDEWEFYAFATHVLNSSFLLNPFDFHGVYHQNSVLSSMYQAVFLQLFGVNNVAWRFSNISLIIPITIFFYLWLKRLFTPRMALISTIVFQCSFYLANFFKVGKNMPQALALLSVCLYMAVRCAHKPTKTNFFVLGLLLGISFYIYIGPIFPLIIWPFFLPILRKHHLQRLLSHGFFLVAGYLLLLLPSLLQLSKFGGPAEKTLAQKEYEGYAQIFINIYHNFLLFFHNYDYLFNQFVAGPYVDILTGVSIIVGVIIAVKNIRQRPYLMLLLSYVSLCIIIGVTSPYTYAPTTRGIFFLPFGAALAGIALTELSTRKRHVYKLIVSVFLVSIFSLNVYHSQIGVFAMTGYSATAMVIKEIQHMHQSPIKQRMVLVVGEKSKYFGYHFFPLMQQAYGMSDVPIKAVRTNKLKCEDLTHGRVLLFNQDQQAWLAYMQFSCPTKPKPVLLQSAIYL